MSHLNTAYQLGSYEARQAFEKEANIGAGLGKMWKGMAPESQALLRHMGIGAGVGAVPGAIYGASDGGGLTGALGGALLGAGAGAGGGALYSKFAPSLLGRLGSGGKRDINKVIEKTVDRCPRRFDTPAVYSGGDLPPGFTSVV